MHGEIETHLVDLQELEYKQEITKHSLDDENESLETFYGVIRNNFNVHGQAEVFSDEEFEILERL